MEIKKEHPASPDLKAQIVLSQAHQFILANGGFSSNNPIRIRGDDKSEMEYLWTALVLIGKSLDPSFNPSSIKVTSKTFHPEDELGTDSTFNENSCYEKNFKNSPEVEKKINEIKEVLQARMKSNVQKYKEEISQEKEGFDEDAQKDFMDQVEGRPPF